MNGPAPSNQPGPLIFIIAGEASGDALGARLMAGVKELSPAPVTFAGVGGPLMAQEGLNSQFPMNELALMGLTEILPHLPRLIRRINETAATITQLNPDVIVTIDAPGFCFRVLKKVAGKGIPLIHYVAPTVWAWKPGRARKVAQFLDHLMVLLPFEPPYFEKEGLKTTFVGHSVVESGAANGDGDGFRLRHGLKDDLVLCLLPGSRLGEVKRLLPIFVETVKLLRRDHLLSVVLPVAKTVESWLRPQLASLLPDVTIVDGEAEKFDAFAAADVALAASGTVSLELALAGTPNVIAYRMNALTAGIVKRMIRVRYANLINLVLEREAVPECIQDNCHPARLAQKVGALLGDKAVCDQQRLDLAQALNKMGTGGTPPSRRAASVVLKVLEQRR